MNTRILMTASAIFAGILGVIALFLPDEVLTYRGSVADALSIVVVQIGGAALISLAVLDWTARGVMIGGIYARPVAAANFLFYFVGAITLGKSAVASPDLAMFLFFGSFAVFAVWYGRILISGPTLKKAP